SSQLTQENRLDCQSAGADDYLSRELSFDYLRAKIKEWFEDNRIIYSDEEPKRDEELQIPEEIEGVEIKTGMRFMGSDRRFLDALTSFHRTLTLKPRMLEGCILNSLLNEYKKTIHDIRNEARMVGASDFARLLFKAELTARNGDLNVTREYTSQIVDYMEKLRIDIGMFIRKASGNENVSKDIFIDNIINIKECINLFDLDGAESAARKMESEGIPDEVSKQVEQLNIYLEDVAMDKVMNKCDECIEIMQRG
nr:hypothetical protein [Lachnospiraceae bacterium]